MRRLLFANELLSHSGEKNCFRKFKVLTFKIVCIFHYCYRYHWYYLKVRFVVLCFKSAEVFTFVKICQKEVLSEERQLMKWVEILWVRIFWVAIFWGMFSRREFDGWEFYRWELPRGGIFLEPFSTCNVSILIF